jgi:hypothetical protein
MKNIDYIINPEFVFIFNNNNSFILENNFIEYLYLTDSIIIKNEYKFFYLYLFLIEFFRSFFFFILEDYFNIPYDYFIEHYNFLNLFLFLDVLYLKSEFDIKTYIYVFFYTLLILMIFIYII